MCKHNWLNDAVIHCSQEPISAATEAEENIHIEKKSNKRAWGNNDSREETLLFLVWKNIGDGIERLGRQIPASRKIRGDITRYKAMIGQEDQTVEVPSASDADFQ